MQKVVEKLKELNKTIATMESCTGGGVANAITNVEGSSEILKFSAVTYSNEYKIKMGVDKDVIDKYSVYSIQTAIEMSKNISLFANSDYGVGITGKLGVCDPNNPYGDNGTIYISIYDKDNNKYYNFSLKAMYEKREDNKKMIINEIEKKLLEII